MFSLALSKGLQIYVIAIVISMVVAVLIKLLVVVTSKVNKQTRTITPQPIPQAAPVPVEQAIPDEVVAAISAALAVITGPHRILHIAESSRSWSRQGRDALHSHSPR